MFKAIVFSILDDMTKLKNDTSWLHKAISSSSLNLSLSLSLYYTIQQLSIYFYSSSTLYFTLYSIKIYFFIIISHPK